MSGDDEKSDGGGERMTSPTWERVLGVIGGVLLVAIVVLVLTGERSPAVVTTEISTIRSTSATVVYDVDVRNDGGETVVDVMVVGELRDGDGTVVATSEATVAFLPGGGTETVSLSFERSPDVLDLTVDAVGWADA